MTELITAYGIDLGTTNSTLARVAVEAASVGWPIAEAVEIEQPTPAGSMISAMVPSMVAVHDGRVWLGEGARDMRALAPDARKKIVRYRTLFYETKNEIGTSRTYPGEQGITTPIDVAARVLGFIKEGGIEGDGDANVVVTVPASFQMRQRQDTMEACKRAGLRVDGHRLLDEPCAAFIDFASRNAASLGELDGAPKRLLVVDFGGGTCDVALFELSRAGIGPIRMKSLAVSRYHRLGGGDIDLAIIHKVLVPALVKENGLSEFDLDFDEVQLRIVPSLLAVAEALKIQLSNELWRLRSLGRPEAQLNSAQARFPQVTKVQSQKLKRELSLSADGTVLTAQRFGEILEPFLTRERLAPAQLEQRIECSMFAPIEDGIDRSGLTFDDVDFVFSVGGSALLPQVDDALRLAFPGATQLRFASRPEFQHAIARGAAVQAWSLARFGHGLVQPVAQDDLFLALDTGRLELMKSGVSLPFPGSGDQVIDSIAVPEDATTKSLLIAFRFVAGRDEQVVGGGTLDVGGAHKGQRIELRYRFDENQVFTAIAKLKGIDDGVESRIHIENPVSNVVNPNATLEQRDVLVEQLRRQPEDWRNLMPRIAALSAELNFHAQAIAWMERYQQKLGRQDPWATNLQGIYEDARSNAQGAVKRYGQAAGLPGAGGAALFNMALVLKREGKWVDALAAVDKAIARESDPPYRVLRLQILESLGKAGNVKAQAAELVDAFAAVPQLNDFELGWLATVARTADRTDLVEAVRARRAKLSQRPAAEQAGVAPTMVKES